LELSPLDVDWAEKEDEVIRQSLIWLKEWHETNGRQDSAIPDDFV
jgi:hypothetical protein